MLICKEQKNPVDFLGRKIKISEQALNAIYDYCATPVTYETIGMYICVKYVDTDKAGLSVEELAKMLTDDEIKAITEQGIKEEVVEASGEEYWNKFA